MPLARGSLIISLARNMFMGGRDATVVAVQFL